MALAGGSQFVVEAAVIVEKVAASACTVLSAEDYAFCFLSWPLECECFQSSEKNYLKGLCTRAQCTVVDKSKCKTFRGGQ